MNKVHCIVNPVSAGGKTAKRWTDIKSIIKNHFKEFKYVFTEKPQQAMELTRELIRDGFDLIIGVGGDGTLNEIVNGFFDLHSGQSINQNAAMGIIASGTGSDFKRLFKIPQDFQRSIALIKNSPSQRIDIGKVEYINSRAQIKSRYFLNVADFGFGAEVIKYLNGLPYNKRSSLAYYRGLLAVLKRFKSRKVKIQLDDQTIIEDKYLIGAIANGRSFGGGMLIAPKAVPDDGFFDLVLIKDMSRREILLNSLKLYSGKIHKHPKVSTNRVKKITFLSESQFALECDGELIEGKAKNFKILHRAIKLRV
jgi:YegS/Rv2252/BmrU family lipid kinase